MGTKNVISNISLRISTDKNTLTLEVCRVEHLRMGLLRVEEVTKEKEGKNADLLLR